MRKLDNIAADMIPIRLIISIAIVAAITAMLAFGYINLRIVLSENHIENECRSLESKFQTMIASGVARNVNELNAAEGTKRVHSFDLPDNLIYLSFGVDPDPDNNGILETGLTDNGAVIFYKIQGGSKKVIWLDDDFKIREGEFDGDKWIIKGLGEGFIIQSPGGSTLNFEYVERMNNYYILIQSTDKI